MTPQKIGSSYHIVTENRVRCLRKREGGSPEKESKESKEFEEFKEEEPEARIQEPVGDGLRHVLEAGEPCFRKVISMSVIAGPWPGRVPFAATWNPRRS